MRLLRPLLAGLILAGTLTLGAGCAGSEEETDASDSAMSRRTIENAAGALTVDYGLGILSPRRFVAIPRDELLERLPEGNAREYAQCLERRRDTVKGDTLTGKTWDYEGERYYVLATELEDSAELRDVHMLFVFSSDGVSRFQVLAWDGRRNLKIAYRQGTPCAA